MAWVVDEDGNGMWLPRFLNRDSAIRHARICSTREADTNIAVWDEENPGDGPIVYRNGKRDKKRFVWLPEGDE